MNEPITDRDLRGIWLDAALRVARQELPLAEGRKRLRKALDDVPLGEAALKKTVTVLARVWLIPAERRASHTRWALDQADRSADWRPLHLGALLANEPFIRSLLDACGREQRAKGEISTVSLRARMRDAHGPKRSIDIATQRGVKTLRNLGVLVGEPQTSISSAGTVAIGEPELGAWLVHCLLVGRRAESIAIEDLGHVPELFAIRLPTTLPRSAAGVSKHAEGVGRVVLALDR